MKGFKEFLFQGNIIDLAVAFVIGSAFAKVVDTFVNAILQPVLNVFAGVDAKDGWGFRLVSDNPHTFVNLSKIISALITFLLTAAILYFLFVLPYKKFRERRGSLPTAAQTETELLAEIRDALVTGRR